MKQSSLVLLCCGVLSCGGPQILRLTDLPVPVNQVVLPNGLRVVVQPDSSSATVLVGMHYAVGAAHDPIDKSGIAHFIEHLAFRASEKSGEASHSPAESKPVTRYLVAQSNAITSLDATFFHKEVLPEDLGFALAEYARQMGDFSKTISAKVFAAELDVVRSERRERRAYGDWYGDLLEHAYPKGHPYHRRGVIGSTETLNNITPDDVSRFLTQHYHPGNATLMIVGPVQPEAVIAAATKAFAHKPTLAKSTLPRPVWSPSYAEHVITVPDAREALVTISWPMGDRLSDEALALGVVDDAMGEWLDELLVYDAKLAFWVNSFVQAGGVESRYVVQALVRDPANAQAVARRILDLAVLFGGSFTVEDFTYAQLRRTYTELNAAEYRLNRAAQFADFIAAFEQPLGWSQLFARLNDLSIHKMKAIATRVLASERATAVLHVPEQRALLAMKPSVTASAVEAVGTLTHEREPPTEYEFTIDDASFTNWAMRASAYEEPSDTFVMDSGLRVHVLQRAGLPIMSAVMMFGGGASAEPRELKGVADITLDGLVGHGRAYWNRRQRMGLRQRREVFEESAVYRYDFPSFYAEHGLDQFAWELTSPRYIRQIVDNLRDNQVLSLRNAKASTGVLAERAYLKARGLDALYGWATEHTAAKVTFEAVHDYFAQVIYPENAVLVVASDRPVGEIRLFVEKAFSRWNAAKTSAHDAGSSRTVKTHGARRVVVPLDTSVSEIFLGIEATGWRDWRRAELTRAATGLLGKRLEHLRETMGLTYGVHAGHVTFAEHGYVQVTTSVAQAETSRAVQELARVLIEARSAPVRDDELALARRVRTLAWLDDGETNAARATAAARRLLRGETTKRQEVLSYIASWTREDLQAAFDELLSSDRILVVAGDVPDEAAAPELLSFGAEVASFSEDELSQ